MMIFCHTSRAPSERRGLATLEMVMATPILMLIMALMCIAGNAGAWKVRTLDIARYTLWGSLPLHQLAAMQPTPGGMPRPTFWPVEGNAKVCHHPMDSAMDDPSAIQPVARGPVLPGGTQVYTELLDPARGPLPAVGDPQLGMLYGHANITRDFPLLQKLGKIAPYAHNDLLDDKWQYWQMRSADGKYALGSNTTLRIPLIYMLAQADTSLSGAYMQAVMAVYSFHAQLTALYGIDSDDMRFRMQLGFPGLPYGSFVPRLSLCPCSCCNLDSTAAKQAVDNLTPQIKGGPHGNPPGVPKIMAQAYLGMYQWAEQQIQNMLQAQPPPSPAQVASLQAELPQIQQDISQLQQFLNTLP